MTSHLLLGLVPLVAIAGAAISVLGPDSSSGRGNAENGWANPEILEREEKRRKAYEEARARAAREGDG